MSLRRRAQSRPLLRDVQARHPRLAAAVSADLTAYSLQRGEPPAPKSKVMTIWRALRLVWLTDAFGALLAYRIKAVCQRRGIPVIPRLAHKYAMRSAQVCIGDRTHVEPGIVIPHGQVVIDGFVTVGAGTHIRPFVTIGLRGDHIAGPTIRRNVKIGTGAKLIGVITVGEGAVIGANSVVVDDVAPGSVVVGAPARPVERDRLNR